jgi:phytoene dehydrogenase-like protein
VQGALPSSAPLVVVGGGVAGLAAALAWTRARPDEPALVLEKQSHVGGYVTSYWRGGFRFDTCQMVPDLDPLLHLLGVALPTQRFERCLQLFRARPGRDPFTFSVPVGHEAFAAAVVAAFPDEASGFARFLSEARSLYRQLGHLKPRPRPWDLLGMAFRATGVIRHGSSSFEAWFHRFGIRDPDLLLVLESFVDMAGLPPSEVHCLVPISTLCSLLEGAGRPEAAFSSLPEALETALVAAGGRVATRAQVSRILVRGSRLEGVRLTDGAEVRTSRVVSTLDPTVAMGDLVGLDTLQALDPAFARKVEQIVMTFSAFDLNLGLDDTTDLSRMDPGCGLFVLTSGEGLKGRFQDCRSGDLVVTPERFHLALSAPSLTVGGAPTLTIRAWPMAPEPWITWRREDRSRYVEEKRAMGRQLESLVERFLVPDLGRHILVRETASPATYARYSGSPTGAIYDMAPSTSNFGRTRLPMRTPVKGLLQPHFVHGVYGALLSGIQAADDLLGGSMIGGRCIPPRTPE